MVRFITGFFLELLKLGLEMSPYLMLGFLFAGILHIYFPKEKVTKYLGRNDFRSVLNSSLIGVPLPLCSCGVIPTGISFFKNGASRGSSVSFLISTPQTGVDSIMATYSLLGLPMAIARPFIAFTTGIFGGLVTNRLEKKGKLVEGKTSEAKEDLIGESKPVYKNSILEMLRYAYIEFLADIAKWLAIGLLIAALIAVLVPDDFFTRYVGNDLLSMLLILAVAVPLYVCATGSIPIAAVLMMKGISPGAAIVFLMAGPATNAATIAVIGKVMGRKTMFAYLFSIISGALFYGLIVDHFLPRDWFTYAMHNMHHGAHAHEMLPAWLSYFSLISLTILIAYALIKKHVFETIQFRKEQSKTNMMGQITVKVEGMTCNHCKMNVENKIISIAGVKEVKVDLASAMVQIVGEQVDLDKVKSGVESIGYKYGGQVG